MRIAKARDNHDIDIPRRATAGSAAFDLRANFYELGSASIQPGCTLAVRTGWIWEIPFGFVGKLYIRSSLAMKYDLTLANSVGVIDSDYRGEVRVLIRNAGCHLHTIRHKDRIAQLIIEPIATPDLVVSESLTDTTRAAGGFGSTGV